MSGERLLETVVVLAAAVAGACLLGWLSGVLVRWVGRRRYRWLLNRLHEAGHRPWVVTLVIASLLLALPLTGMPDGGQASVRHALTLALIAAVAWLATKLLFVAEEAAFQRLRVDVPDNRRMRRLRTQISVTRRLTAAVIIVLAVGAMLVTFDPLRAVGASLLASAGVAGAIAGLAAQTTLSQVFAGLQLAVTDALRLDDVVVVENEWGRVEELTLTHVVLRLWDERWLVLPTSYFTTTPFQNWTRYESRVIGAVLLHLDYATPMDELRAEAHRIVEASPLWDRRAWVVQVVDTTPSTMIVRVLASAADAPRAWDLRCEVRERLIAYLEEHHPEALPRVRIEAAGPLLIPAAEGSEGAMPGGEVALPGADRAHRRRP